MGDHNLSKSEKELILARLEVLSDDLFFSSGDDGKNISKSEMVEHVKNLDNIGKEYIETELNFLRSFKDGSLMNILTS